jgi:hypothetical protein
MLELRRKSWLGRSTMHENLYFVLQTSMLVISLGFKAQNIGFYFIDNPNKI